MQSSYLFQLKHVIPKQQEPKQNWPKPTQDQAKQELSKLIQQISEDQFWFLDQGKKKQVTVFGVWIGIQL